MSNHRITSVEDFLKEFPHLDKEDFKALLKNAVVNSRGYISASNFILDGETYSEHACHEPLRRHFTGTNFYAEIFAEEAGKKASPFIKFLVSKASPFRAVSDDAGILEIDGVVRLIFFGGVNKKDKTQFINFIHFIRHLGTQRFCRLFEYFYNVQKLSFLEIACIMPYFDGKSGDYIGWNGDAWHSAAWVTTVESAYGNYHPYVIWSEKFDFDRAKKTGSTNSILSSGSAYFTKEDFSKVEEKLSVSIRLGKKNQFWSKFVKGFKSGPTANFRSLNEK